MKKKQLMTMGVALGLTAALGIGGTLAILSQKTGVVTNTFTVGSGLKQTDITLDEKDIVNSRPGNDVRTTTGNTYNNIEPASTLEKDPTVTISAEAADCYAFIKVVGMDAYKAAVGPDNVTFVESKLGTEWKKYNNGSIDTSTPGTLDGVYVYTGNDNLADKVSQGDEKFTSTIFDGIDLTANADLYYEQGDTIPEGSDIGDGKTLPDIKIQALAVQATSGEDSWSNACGVVNAFSWNGSLN